MGKGGKEGERERIVGGYCCLSSRAIDAPVPVYDGVSLIIRPNTQRHTIRRAANNSLTHRAHRDTSRDILARARTRGGLSPPNH